MNYGEKYKPGRRRPLATYAHISSFFLYFTVRLERPAFISTTA
jgi:hypothetical protein